MKKILVTGFVGTRPAVIPATLLPFADLLKEKGEIDIRLAVTTGVKGTGRHYQQLSEIIESNGLPLAKPFLFGADDEADTIEQMLEEAEKYEVVYILLKGGKGIWIEQLLLSLFRYPLEGAELFIISSDGKQSILFNSSMKQLEQRQLASLGLVSYLRLSGLECSTLSEGNSAYAGKLSFPGSQAEPLPFMQLTEKHGFLYGSFDLTSFLDSAEESASFTMHYQVAFRKFLNQCRSYGLEKGRILTFADQFASDGKQYEGYKKLEIRAKETGIAFKGVNRTTEAREQQVAVDLVHELSGMISDAAPRNVVDSGDQIKEKVFTGSEADFLCETLIMSCSGADSYVNLLVAASHKPRRIILCYDKQSSDTRIAARRLVNLLSNPAGDFCCAELYTLGTNHMGGGVKEGLETFRQEFSGQWDFNLTPGTKDLSNALLTTITGGDNIWVSDKQQEAMVNLDDGDLFPWQQPSLAQIGELMAGRLLEDPTIVKPEFISKETALCAERIFSYLNEIGNEDPLSKVQGRDRPVFDDGKDLVIGKTGERFNLEDLFWWFSFEGSDDEHDHNVWLEALVAVRLIEAGADQVVCNMKWKWKHWKGFRDELDIVAQFGAKIVVVSCKTNSYKYDKQKQGASFWEVSFMAEHCFSKFAFPVLAVPVLVQPGSEKRLGSGGKNTPFSGCPTAMFGCNHFSDHDLLKRTIFNEK